MYLTRVDNFDRKHIISHSKLYIDSYRRFLQLVTKGRKQSFSRTNMSKSRAFVIFTTSLTLHCIPAHLHRSTLWWIRQYSWSSNDKWVKFSLFVFNDNKLLIRENTTIWIKKEFFLLGYIQCRNFLNKNVGGKLKKNSLMIFEIR